MDPAILRQPSFPCQPPSTAAEASTEANTTVTDPREWTASHDARQQGQQRPNSLDLLQQVLLLPALRKQAILRELQSKACQGPGAYSIHAIQNQDNWSLSNILPKQGSFLAS